MRQRTTYSKPQTLIDWKFYRLRDLFEFFSVPENEREILLWFMNTYRPTFFEDRYKIGNEWYIKFIKFRQTYEHLQRQNAFSQSIAYLSAKYAAEAQR